MHSKSRIQKPVLVVILGNMAWATSASITILTIAILKHNSATKCNLILPAMSAVNVTKRCWTEMIKCSLNLQNSKNWTKVPHKLWICVMLWFTMISYFFFCYHNNIFRSYHTINSVGYLKKWAYTVRELLEIISSNIEISCNAFQCSQVNLSHWLGQAWWQYLW